MMMIEPKYMNEERYHQIFDPSPTYREREHKSRCKFCGGTSFLYGLPDGTVACEGCSTAIESTDEWEGSDVKC